MPQNGWVVTSLDLLVADRNYALGLDDLDSRCRVVHVTVYRIAIRFCTGMGAGSFELYYQRGRRRPINDGPIALPTIYMAGSTGRGVEEWPETAARDTGSAPGHPHGVEHGLTES